jgi:hypothetical protein
VSGSFWGLKKFRMAAIAMVTKVQNGHQIQKCEMIWKIWKKSNLKCEMIWKIQKKIVIRKGKYGRKKEK